MRFHRPAHPTTCPTMLPTLRIPISRNTISHPTAVVVYLVQATPRLSIPQPGEATFAAMLPTMVSHPCHREAPVVISFTRIAASHRREHSCAGEGYRRAAAGFWPEAVLDVLSYYTLPTACGYLCPQWFLCWILAVLWLCWRIRWWFVDCIRFKRGCIFNTTCLRR